MLKCFCNLGLHKWRTIQEKSLFDQERTWPDWSTNIMDGTIYLQKCKRCERSRLYWRRRWRISEVLREREIFLDPDDMITLAKLGSFEQFLIYKGIKRVS